MKQNADVATAAELKRLELLLMDPMVRRNREQVAALLDEEFVEFGSSGRVWTREAILELLALENYTAPEVEDFACYALAESIVLVTYRTVRSDEHSERAGTLRSSIWTKRSGTWRIRFHQGTRANG